MKIEQIDNINVRINFATFDKKVDSYGLTDTPYGRELKAIKTEMLKKLGTYFEEIEAIGMDSTRSDAYNQVEIEKLIEKYKGDLTIRKNNVAEHYVNLYEESRSVINSNPGRIYSDEREIEMRSKLETLKESEVSSRYKSACENDDNTFLVQAVEHAPEPFPLVSPVVIAEGRKLRIEKSYPGVLAEMDAIKNAQMLAENLIDAVVEGL